TMGRKAIGLVAVALALVGGGSAVASAGKSVTPKLGFYKGPEGLLPFVSATGVKVVRVGKRQGAEFEVSYVLNCPHSDKTPQVVFAWVEEKPVRITDGEFSFDRTIHSRVATWEGSVEGGVSAPGTTKLEVSGVFKSASRVVVEASAVGSYDVQYEGLPEEK